MAEIIELDGLFRPDGLRTIRVTKLKEGKDSRGLKVYGPLLEVAIRNGDTTVSMQFPDGDTLIRLIQEVWSREPKPATEISPPPP